MRRLFFFFFQAEDGIRDADVTGVQTCALPISKRLATSLGPVPHFFLTTEVDMERAAEARDALNQQLGDQGKVSFNDILIKAVALALVQHRACHAWLQEDHIRYWNDVHLRIALAIEDPLITP